MMPMTGYTMKMLTKKPSLLTARLTAVKKTLLIPGLAVASGHLLQLTTCKMEN